VSGFDSQPTIATPRHEQRSYYNQISANIASPGSINVLSTEHNIKLGELFTPKLRPSVTYNLSLMEMAMQFCTGYMASGLSLHPRQHGHTSYLAVPLDLACI
jgi:hypothetical protein